MRKTFTTRLLTHNDVKRIISNVGPNRFMDELIDYVRASFEEYAHKRLQLESRIGFTKPKETLKPVSTLEVMQASNEKACFKIVSFHLENTKIGLPTVMATFIYLDSDNGFPLIIADGTLLTALRTGAASAIATQYLAPENAKNLGIIGAGFQGVAHAHALSRVLSFDKIYIYDRADNAAHRFRRRMKDFLNVEIEKIDLSELVRKSDVICTCTYGRKIVVKSNQVRKGLHINAVGADTRGKQELDTGLLKRSKVVVDFRRQATIEGEINVPIINKYYREEDIWCELGQIIIGEKEGRTDPNEVTIFDSTGTSFEDLATMRLIEKYIDKNGKEIELVFKPKAHGDLYQDLMNSIG